MVIQSFCYFRRKKSETTQRRYSLEPVCSEKCCLIHIFTFCMHQVTLDWCETGVKHFIVNFFSWQLTLEFALVQIKTSSVSIHCCALFKKQLADLPSVTSVKYITLLYSKHSGETWLHTGSILFNLFSLSVSRLSLLRDSFLIHAPTWEVTVILH